MVGLQMLQEGADQEEIGLGGGRWSDAKVSDCSQDTCGLNVFFFCPVTTLQSANFLLFKNGMSE
jgi:hypothetical protein